MPDALTPQLLPCIEALRECRRLCAELVDCLNRERRALIAFDMDGVLQVSLEKDGLMGSLAAARAQLEEKLLKGLSVAHLREVASALPAGDRALWEAEVEAWRADWQLVTDRCRGNQRFIQHSLTNLSTFAEHLRRLFGVNRIYSKDGKPVEAQPEGRVVEGRY